LTGSKARLTQRRWNGSSASGWSSGALPARSLR